MKKKKRVRSRSKTEKREDEPPPGPIIILEPKPTGGPLIWLQQTGGPPPAPLVPSSQRASGSLRSDFFGRVNYFKVELPGGTYKPVMKIRATAGGIPQLEVENLGTSLGWRLGTTTLAPAATFNRGEIPLDLTGFSVLEYQDIGGWKPCVSFRFELK